jgi:hypothetical protein
MPGQASLSVAYGFDVSPRNDPIIALADAALRGINVAQTKGRIFNLVPFRKLNQPLDSGNLGDSSIQLSTCRGGFLVLVSRRMQRCGNATLIDAVMNRMKRSRRLWCDFIVPLSFFDGFSKVNQEENKAVPSIATSTITELSENSTPETILMAKALPSTVYLGTIYNFMREL